MVYLGCCRQRKVELGREMKMEVEVLFWCRRLRFGGGKSSKWRGCWYHQEGQGLGAGGGKAIFLAIFDVVSIDAVDGIKKLWVLSMCISWDLNFAKRMGMPSLHYVLKP